ncbi:tRNA(Ile)-lysidine synthase [Candidatus Erwinia haradaeae]|uniref:tRNA(Ile)-lysidine synthase n=1 Tax=Candidatus Erwinia haradaeae TaxID=1922217 RepID=A0A451D0K6_9GAMM|nr:tRNA lysidine(34) synthetase TilS [Candidatus Erwinia haradaeae]VFP79000.1 tRNA(Ile)-lysidine synthase [Candidatus Erwinia haradaeae]
MFSIINLEKFLLNQRSVLIAYSGGLDSSVLLHQLVQLRDRSSDFNLRAAYIDHGLHDSSKLWIVHCQNQCNIWKVPLVVQSIQVNIKKYGLESSARQERYNALYRILLSEEVLLTGHHQDDQCETVLLALKRGSGPAGIAAMSPQRSQRGRHHFRPLLTYTRKALEELANHHGLIWIEDESNHNMRYDRNFLRLQVVPLLKKRWPYFSKTVSRSARLCGEQERLLDEFLSETLNSLIDSSNSLNYIPLLTMSYARRSALLRRWISYQYNGELPSCDGLQRIWTEVIMSRPDANPCLKIGLREVRRFRSRLYYIESRTSLIDVKLLWERPWKPLLLPDGLGQLTQSSNGIALRYPVTNISVNIRFYSCGIYKILGRSRSRSLKKIWQEYKIPPWKRTRIPLIFYGEVFIAAVGVFITLDGLPKIDQKPWCVSWSSLLLNKN